jgi:hydroxymethylpyrimidine/phosphomethylpyrimidine kinase
MPANPDLAPSVLTIAGSDSGGGAGIQADLKTFAAFGIYGTCAITAITAQNTLKVNAVKNVSPALIRAQIESVLDDMAVRAIKTGMLSCTATILAVADALTKVPSLPVVLDPVMVATSGDRLLDADAISALHDILIPKATLLTPNLYEAAILLEDEPAQTETDMQQQALTLHGSTGKAILLKGGHHIGERDESVDYLAQNKTLIRLAAPRIETHNTHGTGCTLSAAITACLASGQNLEEACRNAKTYLGRALKAGSRRFIGHGHGPVEHFPV